MKLKELSVTKVQKASLTGCLIEAPELRYLLKIWLDTSKNASEISLWIQALVNDEKNLSKFLLAVLSPGFSFNRQYYKIHYEELSSFINPKNLQCGIESLINSDFLIGKVEEQKAITQLLQEIKKREGQIESKN